MTSADFIGHEIKMSVVVGGKLLPVEIDELDVDLDIPIEQVHIVLTGSRHYCDIKRCVRSDRVIWMVKEQPENSIKYIHHKKLLSYIRRMYNVYSRYIAELNLNY